MKYGTLIEWSHRLLISPLVWKIIGTRKKEMTNRFTFNFCPLNRSLEMIKDSTGSCLHSATHSSY